MNFFENLNLQTLVYVNSILVSIVILSHMVLIIWNPSIPGIPLWAAGNLALGSGFYLLVLRPYLPVFFTIVLANTLILCGYYLIYLGIRKYMGKRLFSHKAFILFIIFYILYEGYFSYSSFDLVNRASLSAMATAILSFLISWETLQKLTVRSIPYLFFSGTFFIHALFNLLRSFFLLFMPDQTPFFQGGGMAKLLFSELVVFIFAITLGYIFLISARLVEKLRQQAEIDHLTEIFNTRALSKLAGKALSMTRRNDTILSVLLIDIDHFKKINDSYGHAAGDKILRDFARTLSRNIRPSDVVGRIGGEEFTILLPDTDKAEAFKVADRLRSIVETTKFRHKNATIQFTISVGVTSSDGKGKDFDIIMREADTALYQAKKEGRNKAVPYDGSDHVQQRLFLSF